MGAPAEKTFEISSQQESAAREPFIQLSSKTSRPRFQTASRKSSGSILNPIAAVKP